ncbi:MAG: glutathione S-transferase [Thermoplasmata archaeon]|nr:glutathione S-transferase [Thermoplasmata archaeon]
MTRRLHPATLDAALLSTRPLLLRIPFSHYCRKAEWGLTHAGIEYDTLDVALWQMKHARRANPKEGTVPVLKLDDRLVLGSGDILQWAEENKAGAAAPLYPSPEVAEWERWADEAIGPPARREAYRALHADPRLLKGYPEAPRYMAWPVARRLYLNILRHYKARRFEATDPAALREALARVAARLAERGTGFLCASHPTAADYATAALLEPLVAVAHARGLDDAPGWPAVAAFVARVRPTRLLRRRRRSLHWWHWRRFERLA